MIRKALNDLGKPPRFIETRYGSGYRLIGAVEEGENESIGEEDKKAVGNRRKGQTATSRQMTMD